MAKGAMSKKPFRGPPPRPRPRATPAMASDAKLQELIRERQWQQVLTELADQEKRGALPVSLQNVKGVALKNTGQLDAARDVLTKLLEQSPNFVPALINLTNLALMRRDGAQALIHAERAIALKPNDAELYRLAADAYAHMPPNAKGIEYSRRAAELAPDNPMAWFSLSASYYNNGQDDEAMAALDKAMALPQPPAVEVRLRLARAHFEAAA